MTRTVAKNYYEIIDVSKTATMEEIKKAYKKQALKLHPDKNKGPGAEDRFKELQEAYSILSDSMKRGRYDLDSLTNYQYQSHWAAAFSFTRPPPPTFSKSPPPPPSQAKQSGAPPTFSDNNRFNIFNESNFGWNQNQEGGGGGKSSYSAKRPMNGRQFGGGSPRNRTQWQRPSPKSPPPPPSQPKQPDAPPIQDEPVFFDLKVTLEELCYGTVKTTNIEREVLNRAGQLKIEKETLKVEIKPGWKEGTKIKYAQKGDIFPGRIPADIVFTIKERKHKMFVRDGPDIRCNFTISLRDALCGKASIPCLDEPFWMEIDLGKPIQPGTIHRIPERGMPNRKNDGKRGDLLVTFDVRFPDMITDEVRQLAQKLPT